MLMELVLSPPHPRHFCTVNRLLPNVHGKRVQLGSCSMENQRLDWVEGKETKGAHDIGGLEGEYGAIDRTEKDFHLWEMQVDF